jgi:putative tryptophan/tyrosine transport system substrate-binding protein
LKAGRRAVLVALASAPFASLAAERTMKRVVILGFGAFEDWNPKPFEQFTQALAQQGFTQGRNVEVLRVGMAAEGKGNGPEERAKLIERDVLPYNPDVFVVEGAVMTLCLSIATRTVPIVTTSVPDAVETGFASSLGKPGGNITGLSEGLGETSVKVAELVKRLVPGTSRVAIFADPRPMLARIAALYERAAKLAGLEPVIIASKNEAELFAAFRDLRGKRILAGIWVDVGNPNTLARESLAARLPMMVDGEDAVRHGCLASYRGFEPSPYPRLAAVVAQVLRGASPAEIPFQNPQQYLLAINKRTAATLGIVVPPDLLLRADQVFE